MICNKILGKVKNVIGGKTDKNYTSGEQIYGRGHNVLPLGFIGLKRDPVSPIVEGVPTSPHPLDVRSGKMTKILFLPSPRKKKWRGHICLCYY